MYAFFVNISLAFSVKLVFYLCLQALSLRQTFYYHFDNSPDAVKQNDELDNKPLEQQEKTMQVYPYSNQ